MADQNRNQMLVKAIWTLLRVNGPIFMQSCGPGPLFEALDK